LQGRAFTSDLLQGAFEGELLENLLEKSETVSGFWLRFFLILSVYKDKKIRGSCHC